MESKLSSQSSGISLVDISVNDISDSDLDNEDTVLESVASSKSSYISKTHSTESLVTRIMGNHRRTREPVSASGKNGCDFNLPSSTATKYLDHDSEMCRKKYDPMPLGDVKFALQENHELLSDHALLKELLLSIDKKLETASKTIQNCDLSFGPPNRDPGPGLIPEVRSSPPLEEHSSQGVPKSAEAVLPSVPTSGCSVEESPEFPRSTKVLGKHVTFDREKSESRISKNSSNWLSLAGENTKSHELLKQLSSLRWRLNGWEEEGLDPPQEQSSALIFCHKLLQMLQVSQEQKGYLEEQISDVEQKLKKSCEKAEVLSRLNEKRETRLREADAQMALLQHEWITAQAATHNEILSLQKECLKLKKERDSISEDLAGQEEELRRYKELGKEYQKVKIGLEEAQEHFAASRRQTAEIAEENARLNKKLEEKEKYLKEVEEVKLPNLKFELNEAINMATTLEGTNQKLLRTNTHLTDDVRLLHDQHKTLLQKVVVEEKLKETALKEKESLAEQVKNLTLKVSSTKTDLHSHYQAQVEKLVSQKTENLQEQVLSLESTLKDSLAEQLDAQREAHRHALQKIQEGHSKEIQDLCNAHSARIAQLQNEIQQLQEENHAFKTQHQGIISAVSSILTPRLPVQSSQGMNAVSEFPNMASTSTPINTRPMSPQGEKIPKGKISSRNGSRPSSGKSGLSNKRVPCLGGINSSSSDSDASVFQDGNQTVRQVVNGNKYVSSFDKNGIPDKVPTLSGGPLRTDYGEHEFRSLPDLQNRCDGIQKEHWEDARKECSSKDPKALSRKSGSFSGREMSRPAYRKIYRASEILRNEDEAVLDFPSLMMPNGFEMDKIIEEFKSMKFSTQTSESDVPTHDTSFDQDPANITLRKLNQVSTLLSQYVNEAPSSS